MLSIRYLLLTSITNRCPLCGHDCTLNEELIFFMRYVSHSTKSKVEQLNQNSCRRLHHKLSQSTKIPKHFWGGGGGGACPQTLLEKRSQKYSPPPPPPTVHGRPSYTTGMCSFGLYYIELYGKGPCSVSLHKHAQGQLT